MARTAHIERKTAETQIQLELNLDGAGRSQVTTGVGFFDHMLTLLAKHAAVDLTVEATGDLEVDQHHTLEDVGICLGQAIRQAASLSSAGGVERNIRRSREPVGDAPIGLAMAEDQETGRHGRWAREFRLVGARRRGPEALLSNPHGSALKICG